MALVKRALVLAVFATLLVTCQFSVAQDAESSDAFKDPPTVEEFAASGPTFGPFDIGTIPLADPVGMTAAEEGSDGGSEVAAPVQPEAEPATAPMMEYVPIDEGVATAEESNSVIDEDFFGDLNESASDLQSQIKETEGGFLESSEKVEAEPSSAAATDRGTDMEPSEAENDTVATADDTTTSSSFATNTTSFRTVAIAIGVYALVAAVLA